MNPAPGYNAEGRGYPDISLLAHNYIIALNHNFSAVSGTSASSPVFAGMIALVNSKRLAAGRSSLGWVNPALYAYSDRFVRDVTGGNNKCVAVGIVCCSQGFHATAGWDPVTGLGSVNFTAMQDVLSTIGMEFTYPTLPPTGIPGVPISTSTAIPTLQPTPAPSQNAGWMYLRQYQYAQCNGTITSVSGIPTNDCMVEYDEANQPSGSRKFVCQEGKKIDDVCISYFYLTNDIRWNIIVFL